jgi:hypothetical protein
MRFPRFLAGIGGAAILSDDRSAMEREAELHLGFGTETTDQAKFAYFISCLCQFLAGLCAG